MRHDPFDPGRDAELGQLLRECLEAPDNVAFSARLRAALHRMPQDTSWDVLARWARPGMAVAASIAFLVGLWLGRGAPRTEPATLGEAISPTGAPVQLFSASGGLRPETMLFAAAEGP